MRLIPVIAVFTGLLWCAVAGAQLPELTPLEDDTPDAPADGSSPSGPSAEAPVILEEFEVDERTVVLSAARTRTTIQEAPGIITVVTADQIRQRGYRTVNDVLRSVPGFEGGRIEGNGWFEEATARGQPRTLLILLNGVNVTESRSNSLSLDRKIPVEIIKRIEVTSGPGGVLWGSNALLGVVNIILKDSQDLDGVYVQAGGGAGPGAQAAAKGHVAYGAELFGGRVKLFTAADLYTDEGAELRVDAHKVLGVLPEPAPDGKTIYDDRSGLTDFNSRDWWASHTLVLTLFDTITVDWFVQFEQDHRQLATGGALLEGTRRAADGSIVATTEETTGNDAIQMVGINWRDRFLDDDLGVSAKVYGARFTVHESPFWAFPPRAIEGVTALEDGVRIDLRLGELYRYGLNVDADVQLGRDHHLVLGGELFQERLRDGRREDTLRQAVLIPSLADPEAEDQLARKGVFNTQRCPPAGAHDVQLGEERVSVDFGADCHFDEALLRDTDRAVGALYVSDEWKPARTVALQPGVRLQLSDSYDPVTLVSGALVWNVLDKVFLKLNYAEGFRPPSFESTRINDLSISTVSFESDEDLQPELSQASEVELNAVLLEDVGALQRVYLRGDYAYTLLTDVIRNVNGQFANSGERGIHSVEFLARADFRGDHELWLGGHFTRAEDSVFGPVRNFPNWVFMGGGRVLLFDKYLELTTVFTYVGPQEDLNRASDGGVPLLGFNAVDAVDVEVDAIDPYVLWSAGFRVLRLWEDRLELSAFAYNLLGQRRSDPDFFFDDRVHSRPQPRETWSVFGQAAVRLF